jgi:hypothetical protein
MQVRLPFFPPIKLACLSFFTLIPRRVKHLILRASLEEMGVPEENRTNPDFLFNTLAEDPV